MQTIETIILTIQLQTVGRNMMISTHVTNAKCNQYYNVYVGSNSSKSEREHVGSEEGKLVDC